MARVDKHIANHERQPPSASADSHVMSKEAWRCESWEQVQQRAACIDILSHMQGSVGFADHPPCASARHPSSRSCASEAASPCTQPRVLELYCGRGGLSAHHHKMGSAAFFLDWNREYVSKSFHEMPELDAGGQVFALNGLSESNFIHLDFLDFAMAVIDNKINVGSLHAIHDGLDCTTFTDMAVSNSERTTANAFFGTSASAFATNLRYHYLMAFHLFLHNRGQTDHCVRTAENPRATRQFHPLTMNVMEKSKSEGGLGMVKVSLSYCQITTSPCQAFQKDTNLWADYPGILELFVDANGKPKKQCDHRTGICNLYRSHARLRPGKGDKNHREDRGSIYPDALCQSLVIESNRMMGVVRMLPLDPACTADGHRDRCAYCGNRGRGDSVYMCDSCDDVYHYRCIPAGFPKPRTGVDWFCPNDRCQARAKETASQRAPAAAQ